MKRLFILFLAICCTLSLLQGFSFATTTDDPESIVSEIVTEDEAIVEADLAETTAEGTQQQNDKLIALTFDDGPGSDTTTTSRYIDSSVLDASAFISTWAIGLKPARMKPSDRPPAPENKSIKFKLPVTPMIIRI